MNVNDIEDVLNLGTILSAHGNADAAHQPHLIAALLDWKKDGAQEPLLPPTPVAAQPDPEPEPAPAKKAPAKAPTKAPAKPKAKSPVADDDDADF